MNHGGSFEVTADGALMRNGEILPQDGAAQDAFLRAAAAAQSEPAPAAQAPATSSPSALPAAPAIAGDLNSSNSHDEEHVDH